MQDGWVEFLGMPVYSKKNSKQWTGNKLLSSKKVREYEKAMLPIYLKNKQQWKKKWDKTDKPCSVEFYFIRPTKSKFDWVNLAQLPLDMMQTAGLIEDDDCYTLKPVFTGWEINRDKSKCGFKARIKD